MSFVKPQKPAHDTNNYFERKVKLLTEENTYLRGEIVDVRRSRDNVAGFAVMATATLVLIGTAVAYKEATRPRTIRERIQAFLK
jgi:hypothetical protein